MAAGILRTVRTGAVAGVIACAALFLGARALGYERYVVTGGSMGGSIARGAVVFDRQVATASLHAGDVITYAPPPKSGVAGLVTHRIVWAGRDVHGRRGFRTKGDANELPDPWRFTLDAPRQARVAFHVPYAGFALAALSDRRVRLALIGLPALLVALALLEGLWREAGREAAERA